MALTYSDSASLMTDMTFRGRVKVACLKFATAINVEATDTPAHNSRWKWAQQCLNSPDSMAQTVTQPTVMDPAVQAAGSSIDDASLQAAAEGVINGLF